MQKELSDKFFEFKLLSDKQFACEYDAFVRVSSVGTNNSLKLCLVTFQVPLHALIVNFHDFYIDVNNVRGVTGIYVDSPFPGSQFVIVEFAGYKTNYDKLCDILFKCTDTDFTSTYLNI